jgi:hypothetical protein
MINAGMLSSAISTVNSRLCKAGRFVSIETNPSMHCKIGMARVGSTALALSTALRKMKGKGKPIPRRQETSR